MESFNVKDSKVQIISLVIVALVLIFIFNTCSNAAEEDKPPTRSGYLNTDDDFFFYATCAAVDIVESYLNYPLDSEFQDHGDMSVHFSLSDEVYTIKGYVYASNAFGVKSKRTFTVKCTIRLDGDEFYYTKIDCDIN